MTGLYLSRRNFLLGSSALAGGMLLGRGAVAQDAPAAADLAGGPNWTPPDLSGQTIRMWGLNYAPHVERYQMLISKFQELTNGTVTLEPQDGSSIVSSALTSLASRNPPDVLCLMGRMSDGLVKQGGLTDVRQSVYGDLGIDNAAWWFPEALGAYSWGEAIHGVPVEGNAHSGVSVRLDLVDAAGADLAWPGTVADGDLNELNAAFASYDQMFEFAARLQNKGSSPVVWGQNRQGWELLNIATMMEQLGTNWFDEQSGQFAFDSEACVEALQTLVTRPYELGIESKLGLGHVVNVFAAGQSALGIGNDAAAGEATAVGLSATNVVLPSLVAGQAPKFVGEGGWGFEIPVGAKNEAGAIEFLKFMTTYDAQFIWSGIYGGMTPACRPVARSSIYAGDGPLSQGQRRLHTAGPNTRFMGHGWDPQINEMVQPIVDLLREGKSTPKDTASELQRQLTAQQQRFARS